MSGAVHDKQQHPLFPPLPPPQSPGAGDDRHEPMRRIGRRHNARRVVEGRIKVMAGVWGRQHPASQKWSHWCVIDKESVTLDKESGGGGCGR